MKNCNVPFGFLPFENRHLFENVCHHINSQCSGLKAECLNVVKNRNDFEYLMVSKCGLKVINTWLLPEFMPNRK